MNQWSVGQAVAPLRLIFWGGLLCVFDITFTQTVNGQGFRCDILNDALGAFLIAVGVFRLGGLPVPGRYAAVMKFVQVVAVLAVLDAIRAHFVTPLPPAFQLALSVLGLAKLGAIVSFCIVMRWFCEEAVLPIAARSWTVTTALFVVIYVLPLGVIYLLTAVALASGKAFSINLGPAGLLLLPVFAIPIIHLFVSTSRMSREAEAAEVADLEGDEGGDAPDAPG